MKIQRACAVAIASVLCACSAHAAAASPSVAFGLREANGVMELDASSTGEAFTIDPSKLSFVAQPYAHPAQSIPLDARLGAPAAGRPQVLSMRFVVGGAPGPPGLYYVQLRAQPGFASTPTRSPGLNGGAEVLMWWPDTSGNDRSLQEARRRFAGRAIYGYGGVRVNCGTKSTALAPQTPLRVIAIGRDAGKVEYLGTGSTAQWADPGNPGFFAVEPLRLTVDTPAAEGCAPSIVLADWQLDTAITTVAPPPLPRGPYRQLRIGMTREDVAWLLGYPPGFDGLAALQRTGVWDYGGTYTGVSATFQNDRVVAVTTPHPMP